MLLLPSTMLELAGVVAVEDGYTTVICVTASSVPRAIDGSVVPFGEAGYMRGVHWAVSGQRLSIVGIHVDVVHTRVTGSTAR